LENPGLDVFLYITTVRLATAPYWRILLFIGVNTYQFNAIDTIHTMKYGLRDFDAITLVE